MSGMQVVSSNAPRPSLFSNNSTPSWSDSWNYDPTPVQNSFMPELPSFSMTPQAAAPGGAGMIGSAMSSFGNWFGDSGFSGKTLANGDKLQGWGAPVLGAIGGLAQSYLGMQQLGQAKASLAENKRQFDMNWGAQQKTVNSRLEDRQAARVASNPGAYQSVGDYMKKNGI